ncbi:MAG: DNA polymerase IV [Candidatus Cloacimonetes bacterium]|nr:DNA polymerase IV [Candidatus Cloacimonadota bacterium]
MRKIIHIDMDAFFAAVEQRDHPEYRGKAIAVGGLPGSRGVVATCSYEARKYGVHSAMASSLAVKLCPHLIFVRGNYEAYREASAIIRRIFLEYTDLVEPVSIDEAYLDVTVNKKNNPSATRLAAEIRQKIKAETQLTASAGVSYCKFLAKIASDLEKPDGLVVIPPQKALDILSKLPIGKFHGIGKATEEKMKQLGINNGADLRSWELQPLLKRFGKAGQYYYNIVRGIDERQVVTSRIRKSISMERTFSDDIDDLETLKEYLSTIAEKLAQKMNEKGFKALTLTVKLKYSNFEIVQRSCSAKRAFDENNIISSQAKCLLEEFYDRQRSVRLVGIGLSSLVWKDVKISKQMTMPFYEDSQYIKISNNDKIF